MRYAARSLAASLAAVACLWPVAVSAQNASALTVDQARGAFAGVGYRVDPAVTWEWTSPPVTTFQVHDQPGNRILLVLVYPDAAAAQTARRQALADVPQASPSTDSPDLVPGYGASVWSANVALVQTTQSTLDHQYQANNNRNTGMSGDPDLLREPGPATDAVDLDFLQALDNSAVNF